MRPDLQNLLDDLNTTHQHAVETTTGEYTAGMAAGLSLAISAVKFHIHKAPMHDAGMVP